MTAPLSSHDSAYKPPLTPHYHAAKSKKGFINSMLFYSPSNTSTLKVRARDQTSGTITYSRYIPTSLTLISAFMLTVSSPPRLKSRMNTFIKVNKYSQREKLHFTPRETVECCANDATMKYSGEKIKCKKYLLYNRFYRSRSYI